MSILSWLKTVTAGNNTKHPIQATPMEFAEGEEMFHGLDMKQALDAHVNWLHRLEAKLAGTCTEELDLTTVSSDDHCKLGLWIHGSAKTMFGQLQEYIELRDAHAEFHRKVGEVLKDIKQRNHERAHQSLRPVRNKSGEVQLALIRLYSKAQH